MGIFGKQEFCLATLNAPYEVICSIMLRMHAARTCDMDVLQAFFDMAIKVCVRECVCVCVFVILAFVAIVVDIFLLLFLLHL